METEITSIIAETVITVTELIILFGLITHLLDFIRFLVFRKTEVELRFADADKIQS